MRKKDEEYQVEAIIGKRRKKNSGSVEYRVLWNGYPKEQATWQPEEHLENVQYMIDDFNKKIEERSLVQKKQTSPPPATISLKKTNDQVQVPTIPQEVKRKQVSQKILRKTTKESDEDYNDIEEEETYEVKQRSTTAIRGRPSLKRIEQESRTVQKKIISQPVRNAIRTAPIESPPITEVKRPLTTKNDFERQTSIPQDTFFSSDEESSEPTLEITGMFLSEEGKYGFAVLEKKNNRRVTMRRREVVKRDPLALIRFYERALNPMI